MSEGKIWLPPGVERPPEKPIGELNPAGETIVKVNVDKVLKAKAELSEKYSKLLSQTPDLVSKSMIFAYKRACDDMLRAMDKAKVDDEV